MDLSKVVWLMAMVIVVGCQETQNDTQSNSDGNSTSLDPAKVIDFTITNRTPINGTYTVQLLDFVKLICTFSGNPGPSADIREASFSQTLTIFMHTSRIETTIPVSCASNGKYFCNVENKIRDEMKKDQAALSISVKCKPTSCGVAERAARIFQVIVGQEARVRLCMFANPKPEPDLFRINHQITNSNIDIKDVNVTSLGYSKYELMLAFNMEENVTGRVSLTYNGSYTFDFVTETNEFVDDDSEGLGTGAIVGIAVACIVVAAGIICVGIYLYWREGQKKSNRYQEKIQEPQRGL